MGVLELSDPPEPPPHAVAVSVSAIAAAVMIERLVIFPPVSCTAAADVLLQSLRCFATARVQQGLASGQHGEYGPEGWPDESCVATELARRLQVGHDDLGHLHHRAERVVGVVAIRTLECAFERHRDDLPTHTPTVLAPATLAFGTT